MTIDWSTIGPLAPPPLAAAAGAAFTGPEVLLPVFQAAGVEYDVPWPVLAAINEIETGWGRDTGPSPAGAIGWMQFLPGTWARYGVDADGDGVANPWDPVDAIFGAARYLHAAGASRDLPLAVFAYNHAAWYVTRVLERAQAIGSVPDELLAAQTEHGRRHASVLRPATGSAAYLAPRFRGLGERAGAAVGRSSRRTGDSPSIGQVMLMSDRALRREVLADGRLDIYPCGREDIAAGAIDRRVLEVLEYLAIHDLRPRVSALRCGHGRFTTSGNVSEHASGDAVDITAIDGVPILGHQGPDSITETTIRRLLALQGVLRPHQIISLMTFAGAANTLALPDHFDHIHIGFRPLRPIAG